MKKKHLYIAISIILAFNACQEKQEKSNVELLTISVDIKEDALPVSSIAASVKYIPLSNKTLIKDVKNLKFDKNGNIYISDSSGNGIFKFDNSGNFIQQISHKGQGPGEYIKINDFDIDGDNLIINDSRLLYFDLNGNFLKTKSLDIKYSYFATHNDSIYESAGRTMATLIDGKIEHYSFDQPGCCLLYNHQTHFTKNNNSIYWEDCYNDTIYQIFKGKPEPFCYINFKDLKMPSDITIDDAIFENTKVDRYCTDVSFFRISNNLISFVFNLNKSIKQGLFDREKNKSYVFSYLKNDLDYIPIFSIVQAISGNKIYFITSGVTIFNQYNNLKNNKTEEDQAQASIIEKKIGKIPDEMDNPVIIEVTCK